VISRIGAATSLGAAGALVVLSCGLARPPACAAALDAGRPACDYCRMILTEKGFGGEIVTARGRRLIFDSTECMAAFLLAGTISSLEIASVLSVDHEDPRRRLRADRAFYLRSPALGSPMGLNLSAYRSAPRAAAAKRRYPGELLAWNQVLALVDTTWYRRP
jgi:copper chaperone NosL